MDDKGGFTARWLIVSHLEAVSWPSLTPHAIQYHFTSLRPPPMDRRIMLLRSSSVRGVWSGPEWNNRGLLGWRALLLVVTGG